MCIRVHYAMGMSSTSRQYGTASDLVLLQGRVEPETRDMARQRAADLGISMALYLERLVRYDAQNKALEVEPVPYIQRRLSA